MDTLGFFDILWRVLLAGALLLGPSMLLWSAVVSLTCAFKGSDQDSDAPSCGCDATWL